MAKRQGTRRVDSTEVMGEGSFVKFRPILYKSAVDAVNARNDDDEMKNAKLVTGLIVDALLEWDWVDYDGNPLPLPETSEQLEEMLTVNEVQFLTREMVGSGERQKN